MNFKQFLKEDPDGVGEDLSYDDIDAITVTIFKNCYFYAPTREYTHENIFLYLYLNNVSDVDLQELDEEKRNLIKIVRDNKAELFPTKVIQIGNFGRYKKKLIKEFNSAIQYGKFSSGLDQTIVYDKAILIRSVILSKFADVLLARVWKNKRVISFWNVGSVVMSMKNDVYNFLRRIDNFIHNFKFEVGGSLVDYANFDRGNFTGKDLDVSKVHTLSPEVKGNVLKSMGVVPKRPVDLRMNMLRRSE